MAFGRLVTRGVTRDLLLGRGVTVRVVARRSGLGREVVEVLRVLKIAVREHKVVRGLTVLYQDAHKPVFGHLSQARDITTHHDLVNAQHLGILSGAEVKSRDHVDTVCKDAGHHEGVYKETSQCVEKTIRRRVVTHKT